MTLVSPTDINVIALIKGPERYVFLYDDARCGDAIRTIGRFASDPELNFTWYDAALLSQKIRKGEERRKKVQRQLLYKGRFHGEV